MRTSPPLPPAARFSRCAFVLLQVISVALLLPLVSCASPGDPVERKPQVYAPVSDLAAAQSGNDIVLTFTLPKETADHRPATTPASIQIYRAIHSASAASSASASPSTPALLVTIPASMVATYIVDGKFRYADSLTAGDFQPNQQQSAASYTVRTRASPKKESADSNRAEVNIVPAPMPIADLQAQATESSINLSWSVPQATLAGSTPAITGYQIYRANAASTAPAASVPSENGAAAPSTTAPKFSSPLVQIGQSATPRYSDTDVQPEKNYVYSVRSSIDASSKSIESADSNLAAIALHDVYPPSVPTRLIVTPVPAEAGTAAHMDIYCAINPETDLAGYNVYRSEQAGASKTRINTQLLPTPAFSDTNVVPGRTYLYTVTAVDRTGNESAASAAVQSALPAATGNQAP
jgi:hypothetical protein